MSYEALHIQRGVVPLLNTRAWLCWLTLLLLLFLRRSRWLRGGGVCRASDLSAAAALSLVPAVTSASALSKALWADSAAAPVLEVEQAAERGEWGRS